MVTLNLPFADRSTSGGQACFRVLLIAVTCLKLLFRTLREFIRLRRMARYIRNGPEIWAFTHYCYVAQPWRSSWWVMWCLRMHDGTSHRSKPQKSYVHFLDSITWIGDLWPMQAKFAQGKNMKQKRICRQKKSRCLSVWSFYTLRKIIYGQKPFLNSADLNFMMRVVPDTIKATSS